MFYSWFEDSPMGRLLLAGTSEQLKFLVFDDGSTQKRRQLPLNSWEQNERPFRETIRQLKAYFAGKLTEFDLNVAGDGTDFQRRVWSALRDVPFGETVSYGQIAQAIGRPTASRAVGMANGRNPVSIIVPCHRIIGSNGQLVGYGGGLDRKIRLLKLEGITIG
ncbi:MAG: methylated-DNA--[protein]-cysteine S-methyltransferase [Planctomycetaceae bacterium]